MIQTNWDGNERRQQYEFNVRQKIMQAIDAENDGKQRNMLMLMLGMLEAQENGFSRIERKIDEALRNEDELKKTVLNGNYENHDDDHDWIRNQRALDCHAICHWAKQKMAEEAENKKTFKDRWERMVGGVASELPKIVVYAALTLAGYGYLVAK